VAMILSTAINAWDVAAVGYRLDAIFQDVIDFILPFSQCFGSFIQFSDFFIKTSH